MNEKNSEINVTKTDLSDNGGTIDNPSAVIKAEKGKYTITSTENPNIKLTLNNQTELKSAVQCIINTQGNFLKAQQDYLNLSGNPKIKESLDFFEKNRDNILKGIHSLGLTFKENLHLDNKSNKVECTLDNNLINKDLLGTIKNELNKIPGVDQEYINDTKNISFPKKIELTNGVFEGNLTVENKWPLKKNKEIPVKIDFAKFDITNVTKQIKDNYKY